MMYLMYLFLSLFVFSPSQILTSELTQPIYRLTGGKECRGRSRREINEIITAFFPVAGDTQYEAKQLSKNQQLTATFKKPVEMGVSK